MELLNQAETEELPSLCSVGELEEENLTDRSRSEQQELSGYSAGLSQKVGSRDSICRQIYRQKR